MAFQLFRGTSDKVAAYNGMDGEVVYNMDNKSLHVFDGVTPGGYELKNAQAMKEELLAGASEAYDTLKEIELYINSNEGNISSLLTSLGSLTTKANNNETEINLLKNKTDDTRNQVSLNSNEVQQLKVRVGNAETNLTTNNGDINQLMMRADNTDNQINGLNGVASNLSNDINNIADSRPIKPSTATPNGQALAWNGNAFVNVTAGGAQGFTRTVVGSDVEFSFS